MAMNTYTSIEFYIHLTIKEFIEYAKEIAEASKNGAE